MIKSTKRDPPPGSVSVYLCDKTYRFLNQKRADCSKINMQRHSNIKFIKLHKTNICSSITTTANTFYFYTFYFSGSPYLTELCSFKNKNLG